MPAGTGYRAMARAVAEVDPGASGTDHNSVRAYEEGAREPGARYLLAFREATQCDGHWLLTGDGPKRRQPASRKEAFHDEVVELLNRLQKEGA